MVVRHFYHSVHGGCLSGNEANEETLTGMEMTAHGRACLSSDRLIIILYGKHKRGGVDVPVFIGIIKNTTSLKDESYPSRPSRNRAGMLGLAVLPSAIMSRY